jgi:hypothetical protein
MSLMWSADARPLTAFSTYSRGGLTDVGTIAAMACRKELKPIRVAIRMPIRVSMSGSPGASSDASPIHGRYSDREERGEA